jgi:hypothetical protein
MYSRPWRIIPGTGQTLALTSGTAGKFANPVGAQTYAFVIRLAPSATAYIAMVTVSKAGTLATASTDYPISTSDPPITIVCAGGDSVSVYQASGSSMNAYLCELTR